MTKRHDHHHTLTYGTLFGLVVIRRQCVVDRDEAVEALIGSLDRRRGALLSSGYEYPGRYSRWDLGFVDPPIAFTAADRDFHVEALNDRGRLLLGYIAVALESMSELESLERRGATQVQGRVRSAGGRFAEELRSRQPSVFSVIRRLVRAFRTTEDSHLGLYGAFGYDLCFQFEPIPLSRRRPDGQRDLVLYLPDRLVVADRQTRSATRLSYEFEYRGRSTLGLSRATVDVPFTPRDPGGMISDHAPGEYASKVARAREQFRSGALFELVLSQTFTAPCTAPPSTLFRRLAARNPAPFAFFLNLGRQEYLVGASPEMYVRVNGERVETCPIAGTIARGGNPIEDASQIRKLIESEKDESELTMCTDVDRNDKSRICLPGSVRVLGRRQIELYSKLIHTVDHVEGQLRPEFDALDAFLTHTWAVTVTGAPKLAAIRSVEEEENSPRAWYGGAVGVVGFDGSLNTGLTLRTIRIVSGLAEVRAGATLLFDSDPEAEELETRLKASAMLDVISGEGMRREGEAVQSDREGSGLRILLVDHEDSFVHTLANYLRQTGAEVTTERGPFDDEACSRLRPDIVVLSPGPGRPQDFQLGASIDCALRHGIPLFGVCLGLQGIVEFFGGELKLLETPMHGRASEIRANSARLFAGLPERFTAGRYHSLLACARTLPKSLRVTARTDQDEIMAIEHVSLPVTAVQFHPESLLSLNGDIGLRLLRNMIHVYRASGRATLPHSLAAEAVQFA